MGAVTIEGMLAAEKRAIAAGWTEEALLDLAGQRLGRAIGRFFPLRGTAIGYLGKGHNAGDTLVALGVLRDEFGWRIEVRMGFPLEECAPLVRKKWQELGVTQPLDDPPPWRDLPLPLLLLDGLLGSGAKGALRAPLVSLGKEMAELRNLSGARIAAVDLPSGIDADLGTVFENGVTADATFMIANAKRGLLLGHAANTAGNLVLVPVEPLSSEDAGDLELIAPQIMTVGKSPRPFDFHKGTAGKVGIVAGSRTYTGAAVLAAMGALRAGAGLITLMVPENAAALISSKCPPEIMIRGIDSFHDLRPEGFDSLVLGCGLGELEEREALALLDLIRHVTVPTVVDADAVNLIANHGALEILQTHHVLTPHPGEFRRLAPDLAELPREAAARGFVSRYPSTLLLKGARTIIARRNSALWINSTGSPGMATGGQGDLLSGVIGALLAIGHPPHEAAALGAWLCGRAAEIAIHQDEQSEESLTPSDVAARLGRAFLDWQRSAR